LGAMMGGLGDAAKWAIQSARWMHQRNQKIRGKEFDSRKKCMRIYAGYFPLDYELFVSWGQ